MANIKTAANPNNQKTLDLLLKRQTRLEQILNTPCPIVEALYDGHERIQNNASNYYKELVDTLIPFVKHSEHSISIYDELRFKKELGELDDSSKYKKASADKEVSLDEEGEFFRLAFIDYFPYGRSFILWLKPLSKL